MIAPGSIMVPSMTANMRPRPFHLIFEKEKAASPAENGTEIILQQTIASV